MEEDKQMKKEMQREDPINIAEVFAVVASIDPELISEGSLMNCRTEHRNCDGDVYYLFTDGSIYSVKEKFAYSSLDSLIYIVNDAWNDFINNCKTIDDVLKINCNRIFDAQLKVVSIVNRNAETIPDSRNAGNSSEKGNNMASSKSHNDAVEWATALMNLIKLAPTLQHDVEGINMQFTSAYSMMSWRSVCRHLRCFANGMNVMQMLAEGKSNAEITAATGIPALSIAAYKGCNTASAGRCGVNELIELSNNINANTKVITKEK
jgi:hypothetical protein